MELSPVNFRIEAMPDYGSADLWVVCTACDRLVKEVRNSATLAELLAMAHDHTCGK